MTTAKFLRICRAVVAVFLVLMVALAVALRITGLSAILTNAVVAAVLALVLFAQTKRIRRIERANRPRPDYSLIAAMEREVYGETFGHDGAPEAFAAPSAVPFMSAAELRRSIRDLDKAIARHYRARPRP